jgi:hypothetical protein
MVHMSVFTACSFCVFPEAVYVARSRHSSAQLGTNHSSPKNRFHFFLEGQSLFSEAMNQASPEFPSMDRGVRLTSVALFVQVFFGARNEQRYGSM